jgi:hypothetical protein
MKFNKLAVIVLALAAAVPAIAAEQSFKGYLSDTMCGRKHMMPGKSDAECIRECVKAGSKYALMVGDKMYTLQGPAAQFDKLAGQQVQVSGDLQGSTMKVAKIAAAK